eukprot:GHVP01054974.1.p1 GENE.GHVP01054974.1~~GHVP01054974.1.p1  ORF type:complete len:261 (+),score=41.45 GHVP01054974.1:36-818(+)
MGGSQSLDTGERLLKFPLGRIPRFRYFPHRRFEYDFSGCKEILGTGINGKVYVVGRKLSNQKYVAKFLNKKQAWDRMSFVKEEVYCHLEVDHPHVQELFAIYEDSNNITYVMEHCPGQDLQQHLEQHGPLSERVTAQIAHQMLLTIRYIHNKGIVHRDIKLENFVLHFLDGQRTMPRVKLIDFGFARKWTESDKPMEEQCGSLSYWSPEILEGSYTSKSDIWAVGICLYRMMCGIPPFFGTEKQIIKRIIAGNISYTGGT